MNGIMQANQTMPPVEVDMRQQFPSTAIRVQIHDGLARIAISGKFDFQMNRDFRKFYAPLLDNAAVKEIRVDMSKVDYLDSSAMGMLLLLDERAKAANKPASLLIASGVVQQVLEVANFGKVFNIEHFDGMPIVNDTPLIAS